MASFVSPEQILANQRNAQKCTGPKTPEGKEKSSRNAIKHGLLAKGVVIDSPTGAEDQAEFDAMLADICEELQPRGFIEQTLVERIATCYWRLHRAQRFESGSIRESLESPEAKGNNLDDLKRKLAKFEQGLEAMERLSQLFLIPPPSLTDADKAELKALAESIPRSPLEEAVTKIYGMRPHVDCAALRTELPNLRTEHLEKANQIRTQLEEQEGQGKLRVSRKTLVGSLPSDAATLKLIRYETMLDRQIHRAFNELRRHRERGALSDRS